MDTVNATIRVGVVFEKAKIFPRWFIWEDRKYTVKEINYIWLERQGQDKLYCFSLTDGINNYEISFNAGRAIWTLNKIYEVG
jgi:hypothetical protein